LFEQSLVAAHQHGVDDASRCHRVGAYAEPGSGHGRRSSPETITGGSARSLPARLSRPAAHARDLAGRCYGCVSGRRDRDPTLAPRSRDSRVGGLAAAQVFAYSSADLDSNSYPTKLSSPTTQALWPGSITYASPAAMSCSVPSLCAMCIAPDSATPTCLS